MATLLIKKNGKFPCELIMGNGGKKSITPTMVDFDNCQAWHQRGQASENGVWIEFDNIRFATTKEERQLTERVIDEIKVSSKIRTELYDLKMSIEPTERIINSFADLFLHYKRDFTLYSKLAKSITIKTQRNELLKAFDLALIYIEDGAINTAKKIMKKAIKNASSK
ncbi:hypothetical protein LCGC14_1195860 [marine sediment metagenome]|uniref:Uncharacterized protein n=1 Tax=marine sediment metagenome TaxID=412755 RepID=A0A0F9P0T1_9ZZZZ